MFIHCVTSVLFLRSVRNAKEPAGHCPPPSPAILLPPGEWPRDDPASEEPAGSGQPGRVGSSSRPSVHSSWSEDGLADLHILDRMRITFGESCILA